MCVRDYTNLCPVLILVCVQQSEALWFIERGSNSGWYGTHSVAHISLELVVVISCLSFLNAGIPNNNHQVQFKLLLQS